MSLKEPRTGVGDSRIPGLSLALTGYLVLLSRLFTFSQFQFPNLGMGIITLASSTLDFRQWGQMED